MRRFLRNDDRYTVTCEYVPHLEVFRCEVASGVEVLWAHEDERADRVIEFAARFCERRIPSTFHYELVNDRDEVRVRARPMSAVWREECYRKVHALYGGRGA